MNHTIRYLDTSQANAKLASEWSVVQHPAISTMLDLLQSWNPQLCACKESADGNGFVFDITHISAELARMDRSKIGDIADDIPGPTIEQVRGASCMSDLVVTRGSSNEGVRATGY